MQSQQAAAGYVYGSQWQESWDCIPAYSLFNQARSMAPRVGSRRSIWSMPVSSSKIEITDGNRLDGEMLPAHAMTFLSAFLAFAFRNSETTLVSRIYIKRDLL